MRWWRWLVWLGGALILAALGYALGILTGLVADRVLS